jgi:hypothetical protein
LPAQASAAIEVLASVAIDLPQHASVAGIVWRTAGPEAETARIDGNRCA